MDRYRKAEPRLTELAGQGLHLRTPPPDKIAALLVKLSRVAHANGMEVQTCAEPTDFSRVGIPPGKCIDPDIIARLLGRSVTREKDPNQRSACGCVTSRDIGAYDTCLFGCRYCYATSSLAHARQRHAAHDPTAPSLCPAGP